MPPAKTKKRNPPAKPADSARLHIVFAACGLIALVLIVYSNSINNGFVWDDHQQIVMNPALKPDSPLSRLFTADVRFAHQYLPNQNDAWRPFQMLTYRILATSFGLTPAPFHLASIALAVAGVLAAFALFRLLLRSTFSAFAAAALFAVHPIHTEAVDWIAASPDLGCALFIFLSFALFLESRNTLNEKPRQRLLILSLAAYAIALLWKETAVVLPLLIVFYVLLLERPQKKSQTSPTLFALKSSAGFWAVLAAYLALRVSVLGTLSTGQRIWAMTPLQFLLTALHLMLFYWQKLLLPFHLNAYYLFSPIRALSDPRVIASILFLVVAIAALFYLVRRAPLCAFAALWVCVTLLPALDVYALGRNAFAERYLYLPSAGFCLLLTAAATQLLRRAPVKLQKPAAILLTLAATVAFAVQTIQRNLAWKDDKTLFSQTLLLSPTAPFVRNMVATGQSDDPAQSTDAEQNYLQAIAMAKAEGLPDRPDLVTSYEGLASLYADRSDNQKALQMLSQAREIDPADPEVNGEEGLILARSGHWNQAEPLLEKTLAQQPQNENVLSTLGLVAWQYHHDRAKAIELFTRALAAHPDQDDFNASLHSNLATVYADQGDYSAAIQQFKLAVSIAPQDAQYHTNLANALGAANRLDEARTEAETALQLSPNDPAARAVLQNLGVKQ